MPRMYTYPEIVDGLVPQPSPQDLLNALVPRIDQARSQLAEQEQGIDARVTEYRQSLEAELASTRERVAAMETTRNELQAAVEGNQPQG